jgi:redox-regulated HSP33 family molecular chaperone
MHVEHVAATQTVEIEFEAEAVRRTFLTALALLQDEQTLNSLPLPAEGEAACDFCSCTL